MIIKSTLIAKDIDIKVAISVEITVTSVNYQFEITDWHINCQSIGIYFLTFRSDNNQQPIAILVALWSHFLDSEYIYLSIFFDKSLKTIKL